MFDAPDFCQKVSFFFLVCFVVILFKFSGGLSSPPPQAPHNEDILASKIDGLRPRCILDHGSFFSNIQSSVTPPAFLFSRMVRFLSHPSQSEVFFFFSSRFSPFLVFGDHFFLSGDWLSVGTADELVSSLPFHLSAVSRAFATDWVVWSLWPHVLPFSETETHVLVQWSGSPTV